MKAIVYTEYAPLMARSPEKGDGHIHLPGIFTRSTRHYRKILRQLQSNSTDPTGR